MNGAESKRRSGWWVAALVIGLIALIALTAEPPKTAPPAPVAKLDAKVVTACRDLLAGFEREGVIRGRPSPTRINVEDAAWAALPADVKDATMKAVACDVWQTAMPPDGLSDYVVAYGYRSGKRIQMLMSDGMVRE